jgi:hypothetical protein
MDLSGFIQVKGLFKHTVFWASTFKFQDVNHVIPRHGPFKDGGCSNFSRQNIHEIKFSVSGMNDFTPLQLKQNFFDPWIETQF